MKADIIIVGGGIVGSSIAYHLSQLAGAGTVLVLERDHTYTHAATPLANGGIRRLFSLPENIQMADFGLSFYQRFSEDMRVEGHSADIGFRRQGYLFLSDNGGAAQMEENFRMQESMGVPATLLSPTELSRRFPSVKTTGVDLAVLSDQDGWIDPHAALMGFRRKAIASGVTYKEAEVIRLEKAGNALRRAHGKDGATFEADVFINASGAWCAELAQTVDLKLPVEPMSRESYFFRCGEAVEPLPFIKTETDLAFRPEGQGYVGGVPDWSEKPGWNFSVAPERFNSVVWPALAERIPAMQSLKLERSWRGHYARSVLDYSPILGPCRGVLDNFFLANGFSGHGIMHAPAVGRGLAEYVVEGACQTLDLDCFGYRRILENRPYREKGII